MNTYVIKVIGEDLFIKPNGIYTKNKSEAFSTDDGKTALDNANALSLAHMVDKKPVSFEVVIK